MLSVNVPLSRSPYHALSRRLLPQPAVLRLQATELLPGPVQLDHLVQAAPAASGRHLLGLSRIRDTPAATMAASSLRPLAMARRTAATIGLGTCSEWSLPSWR
jgi:hypothetical protein